MKKSLIFIFLLFQPLVGFSKDDLLNAVINKNTNFILQYQGDINKPLSEKGLTALMISITNGNKEAFSILLSMGADVNVKSKNGSTPLLSGSVLIRASGTVEVNYTYNDRVTLVGNFYLD